MNNIFADGPRPASITAFLLTTVLVVLIMINGSTILVPIVVAIGIWLVLNNVADLIHRKNHLQVVHDIISRITQQDITAG